MPVCFIHNVFYKNTCSECAHMMAKAEKQEAKEAKKLSIKLLKQKEKQSQPRVVIAKQSDKLKEALKTYRVLRKQYLSEHPECELKLKGCDNIATDIHHTASRGINLNNVSTWKSACRECHMKLHNELSAEEVRELGLKTSAINQERETI